MRGTCSIIEMWRQDGFPSHQMTCGNFESRRPTFRHYRSSWECLARVAQDEGINALWRGSVIRLCRLVPGQAITFGAFGYFSHMLEAVGC